MVRKGDKHFGTSIPPLGTQDGYIRYPDKHIQTGGVCEACQRRQATTEDADFDGDSYSGQKILHPVCASCKKKDIDWQGIWNVGTPKEQAERTGASDR